ncbi:hypothetical protein Tcur_4519 [Thermomonospora curvata DSM 43183]|uniref:Uncharacterized protein n=1 Tax=Thermomonospora curvata (strain ATCC 19995 / DSM 43183 / JCM 3096 / KCTC 9072 / NBRC 15933 / NCIMB 10081 / Henssen B9) TaxID=471852 RepID=D1A561_THECD|nr:hypothetical protein Tcur_4519 [Thermomonospora curvata DSM 43183]
MQAQRPAAVHWPASETRPHPVVMVSPTLPEPSDDRVTTHVRGALAQIMRNAFENAGIAWDSCLTSPRGNARIVVPPLQTRYECLAKPLMDALLAEVSDYNELHSEAARLYLRTAVHMGSVSFDMPFGQVEPHGRTVEETAALADADEFVAACLESAAEVGFIVSHHFYEQVIQRSGNRYRLEMCRPLEVTWYEGPLPAWTSFRPWSSLHPKTHPAQASHQRTARRREGTGHRLADVTRI